MTARTRLRLEGQPREILRRMRPAFREHVRPHTPDGEGERLGGGSMLNAQWDHRLSRDIDVYIRLATKEDARTVLDRAAAACNGYRVEHPNFPRIEFERGNDNHIDVTLGTPNPQKGERLAVVDGEATLVLSNAQIMTGKLQGRGMTGPGRDVFDVAVCGRADPQALEIAVNALDDTTVDAILKIYKLTREQYGHEVAELDGVPEGLKPVQANPTAYANDAILNCWYERVTIRTVAGKGEIETRTRQGSARTRTYATAEDLVDGMERDGINAFLRAQYRNEEAVLDDTIDNLRTGRTVTIIEIEPGRPRHDLLGMPEIRWSPPTRRPGGEPANG